MRNFFLGLTLGNDPHTVGIYKAGRIAKMAGIEYYIIPPAATDEEKLKLIDEYDPVFLGISYRLSTDKAIEELKKFLYKLETAGLLNYSYGRKICFAGLLPTLDAVRTLGLDIRYNLYLMGSCKDIYQTTISTIDFFNIHLESKREEIVATIRREMEPERIEILDQMAKEVIASDDYQNEMPLKLPSKKAQDFLPIRIAESEFPVIRTHFGIPDDTIMPTIEGIEKIANAHAVDEISLGSSDLSQRYFGMPSVFSEIKNDGGVPYKTKDDLSMLYIATRRGNYPSIKPYCHVTNIRGFIDDCLETKMLIGAHQAIPLFWFSELDGRGPLSVPEAIDEHIEAVKYLVSKNIPVEMNDPNQWSSRFAHDTVFVSDYALISSVMYQAGLENMILQCQFNKPAETGDYADLAKMTAVIELVNTLRPKGNSTKIFIETRAGIEHFSTDLDKAKYQLARSTLLQMLVNPNIIHLVSYCEANHAATADDVIESSKIVRRAVGMFKKNEFDIRKAIEHPFVSKRRNYLFNETKFLINQIAKLSTDYKECQFSELYKYLSQPQVLKDAIQKHLMTAPGITHPNYENPLLLTRPNEFGSIDCFLNWDDTLPITEKERIAFYNNRYD